METSHGDDMEKDLHESAKKRVKEIKDFYIHLLIYSVGMLVYILKESFGLPFNFPPISYINCSFIAIWTFALIVQALHVFMSEVVLGEKWKSVGFR
jgi:hypothetical protein